MPVPALGLCAAALARRLPPGSAVLVAGPHAQAAGKALEAAGLRPAAAPPVAGAALPQASAAGPVVSVLEALAADLPSGAPAVVGDLMWRTAPTPDLLAAFPGTRPMEGYEMQAEHAGFAVADRIDAPPTAWSEATLSAAQRAAVQGDPRGAALWRWLVLIRE